MLGGNACPLSADASPGRFKFLRFLIASGARLASHQSERRTRLTKPQAERVDQILLELAAQGRTGKADLDALPYPSGWPSWGYRPRVRPLCTPGSAGWRSPSSCLAVLSQQVVH